MFQPALELPGHHLVTGKQFRYPAVSDSAERGRLEQSWATADPIGY
ncbi:hypothetical protein [Nocardia barduliensis]|nr:hypothetical protein [Nocardia barduliensis]